MKGFVTAHDLASILSKRQVSAECPATDWLQSERNTYKVHCGRAMSGGTMDTQSKLAVYDECIHECNKRVDCIAAQWLERAVECTIWKEGGHLIIKKDVFVFQKSVQPESRTLFQRQEVFECPTAPFHELEGYLYEVRCGKAISDAGQMDGSAKLGNYDECIRVCSKRPNCLAAQWLPAFQECTLWREGGMWVDKVDAFVFQKIDWSGND